MMTPGLTRALRRLRHDERGTTITEFIIVLPVFVLIFGGTLALSRLQHTGVEVQIRASRAMWEDAMNVQLDNDPTPAPNHADPSAASNEALSLISKRTLQAQDTRQDAHAFAQQRWQATESGGHMAEAQAMVSPITSQISTDLDLKNSILDLYNETQLRAAGNLLHDGSNIQPMTTSVNTRVGHTLLDTTQPLGQLYTNATSMSPNRLAVAAGFRYGLAQGYTEIDVTHPLLPTPKLSAGFETLVAPRAQVSDNERLRTNLISNMTFMGEDLYSTMLGIEVQETLTYDDTY